MWISYVHFRPGAELLMNWFLFMKRTNVICSSLSVIRWHSSSLSLTQNHHQNSDATNDSIPYKPLNQVLKQ